MTNGLKPILNVCIYVGLLSLVAHVQPGMAATFNIPNGDVAGLIAAINAANANPGADIINLATSGTYTLTAVDNTGYYGPTGLPVIVSPITINGNGATIRRTSAPSTPDFRIFLVSNGPARLTLNGLTVEGGRGGGWAGAGILNTGSLLITNSTVTKNVGVADDGGGIFNYCGTLTITNSTISNNKSLSGYGGGGVLNLSSYCQATTTIINSTIFENVNTFGRGDAIADAFSPPGSVVLRSSIFASPTQGLGSVCYAGGWGSLGHNIAGDTSCGFTGTGDRNNTNPLLGPLTYNGGPTPTNAPLPRSPAIDAVPLADCTDTNGIPLATDQRGVTRPKGTACDIGSVESNAGTVVAWGGNSQGPATVPAGLTDVVAVSGGGFHTLALKSDATVVAWGWNIYGQASVPAGLTDVTAISAGYLPQPGTQE